MSETFGYSQTGEIWGNDELVAADAEVESGWVDIGKRKPELQVLRTSTGGTYELEIDWSEDAGATTLDTDTITATDGEVVSIPPGSARWCRIRVSNTSGADDFTAHETMVIRDAGTGVV